MVVLIILISAQIGGIRQPGFQRTAPAGNRGCHHEAMKALAIIPAARRRLP
ncbi:MAG TPA: hypothetical protein VFN87_07375 [Solirubrobacteraceae bacterium]|nr:hypothetical protein [Solirubrobacteraceae bacterium]